MVLPGYDGRDRTYFFGEYQGFRQVLGTTQVFPVPTAAERQGIDTTTFPGRHAHCSSESGDQAGAGRLPSAERSERPYGARTYATSSKVSTVTTSFPFASTIASPDKSQLFGRFSLNQVTGPVTNPDQTAIDPSFGIQFFDHQRNAGVSYARTIIPT